MLLICTFLLLEVNHVNGVLWFQRQVVKVVVYFTHFVRTFRKDLLGARVEKMHNSSLGLYTFFFYIVHVKQ